MAHNSITQEAYSSGEEDYVDEEDYYCDGKNMGKSKKFINNVAVAKKAQQQLTQNKPAQNKPAQNKPAQNKPAQNKPTPNPAPTNVNNKTNTMVKQNIVPDDWEDFFK